MIRTKLAVPALAALLAVAAPAAFAAEERPLRIDVPVKLEQAKVVFNMDHLAFQGDYPVGMKYMHLLAQRLKETGAKGHIVAVFHGAAAYMTLNDRAYDASRKVSTGNPFKKLVADLLAEGVEVEECAVSMRANGWSNDDLLPGVQVNSGAVGRIVQLVQQGYVQIQP